MMQQEMNIERQKQGNIRAEEIELQSESDDGPVNAMTDTKARYNPMRHVHGVQQRLHPGENEDRINETPSL